MVRSMTLAQSISWPCDRAVVRHYWLSHIYIYIDFETFNHLMLQSLIHPKTVTHKVDLALQHVFKTLLNPEIVFIKSIVRIRKCYLHTFISCRAACHTVISLAVLEVSISMGNMSVSTISEKSLVKNDVMAVSQSKWINSNVQSKIFEFDDKIIYQDEQ